MRVGPIGRSPWRKLHRETSRHGTVRWVVRNGHGPRIPIDYEYGTPEFMTAYRAALAGNPLPARPRPQKQRASDKRKNRVLVAIRSCLKGALSRSRQREVPFNLTEDWALETLERQRFRCALTKIPFYGKHDSKSSRNPYVPSFDRIDPTKGYTTDNVRIVLFAVNTMLLDWGEEIFLDVANAYRANRTKRENLFPTFRTENPNLKTNGVDINYLEEHFSKGAGLRQSYAKTKHQWLRPKVGIFDPFDA
jgi:hypothetical protein